MKHIQNVYSRNGYFLLFVRVNEYAIIGEYDVNPKYGSFDGAWGLNDDKGMLGVRIEVRNCNMFYDSI